MEKLSPFYAYYVKGCSLVNSESIVDLRLAVEYLEKSLKLKETEYAFQKLLSCYVRLKDNESYGRVLQKAAKSGFGRFYPSCGVFFANSDDPNNAEKALWWFKKAMNEKNPRAYAELGKLYMYGCKAFKKDYKKADELFAQGLMLENPKWQGYLFWLSGMVELFKNDYKTAGIYFQEAVALGYMPASYELALLHRDGAGVEESKELYIENLLKHKSKESAFELGGIFTTDIYAERDDEAAYLNFDYAAKLGHPVAAIMVMAILLKRNKYEKSLFDRYLTIASTVFASSDETKQLYETLDTYFGQEIREKIQMYANDNQLIQRGDA